MKRSDSRIVENKFRTKIAERGLSVNYTSVASVAMRAFWDYAIESLLHGYPVRIPRIGTVSFCYASISDLKRFKGQKFFSDLISDYFFFFDIDGEDIKNNRYNFILKVCIKRKIERLLNTDVVYKMIGK